MNISVTQSDINNGTAANCRVCPIALAIQRVMEDPRWTVHYGTAFCGSRMARLPVEASRFVRMFDTGWPVEPFEFELDLTERNIEHV
jgi:hypothetical protein